MIEVDQNDDWSVDVVAMFHFCSIGTENSDYYFYSRLLFTRYRNGYFFFCSIGTERTFTADYFLQDTGMVITFTAETNIKINTVSRILLYSLSLTMQQIVIVCLRLREYKV
jgi:hypothetical protein